MMSLLFVDHEYHRKTLSSNFFVKILERCFLVKRIFIQPELDIESQLIDSAKSVDVIVLWQMDYLAPVFLSQGIPTVVIPMFDGSSLMPDLHWLWAKNAHFINFSFALHHRLRILGCSSMLVKYFLPAVAESKIASFEDGLRVFLWQRRPEEGINLKIVEKLFGSQLKSVHIHNAPDNKDVSGEKYIKSGIGGYDLTISNWFSDKSDYSDALVQSNIFLAPRLSEGIGLAMLEAMARGMVVVANDLPTHNEYISNWVNGVLFNLSDVGYADFGDAARIGRMAWQTVRDGHPMWLAASHELIDFIRSSEKPTPVELGDPLKFARSLSRAYFLGRMPYSAFLSMNVKLIEKMNGGVLLGELDGEANLLPARRARKTPFGNANVENGGIYRWVEDAKISGQQIKDYAVVGEVIVRNGIAWIKGHAIALGIHFDPAAGQLARMNIEFSKPEIIDKTLLIFISVNDYTVATVEGSNNEFSTWLDLPVHTMRSDNVIRIQCSTLGLTAEISAPVSIGIKAIRFA